MLSSETKNQQKVNMHETWFNVNNLISFNVIGMILFQN